MCRSDSNAAWASRSNECTASGPQQLHRYVIVAPCMLKVNESTKLHSRIRICAGPIPTEVGQLVALQALALSTNQLCGRFLFAHCTSMAYTRIPTLMFEIRICAGPIPTEIGQLTALKTMGCSENFLYGRFLYCSFLLNGGTRIWTRMFEFESVQVRFPRSLGNLRHW